MQLQIGICRVLNLDCIYEWGKNNLVSCATKTQYLQLTTLHYLLHNYPLYLDNTQLFPSSTLNLLKPSPAKDLH